MDLRSTQLKDTYGNLVTTGTTEGSPTTGGLQNGDGQLLTSVGIGTNSPSSFFVGGNNLVVGENSSDNGITIFTGTSNTGYLLFSNGTSGNEQYKGQVRYNNSTDQLQFLTAGNLNPRLTIDSSGNVGIGETNPSNKLEVNSGSTQTVSIFKASSTSTATNNGGALIGIRNTNNTNGNMEGLFFQNSNGVGTSGIIGYNVNHTTGEGLMTFGVRNSSGTFGEKMRIDSSGNVGINNTSPSSFLSNGRELVLGDGSASHGMTIFSDSAGTGNLFFADGTTGDEAYRGFLRYAHSSDNMEFYTAGSNLRMTIDSSGNLLFDGAIEQTSRAKTIVFSKTISDNVATYIAHHSVTPSSSTTMVTIVIDASGGYAVETYRYLWNTRAHGSGNNRSVVSLTGADLGSVNAGVVAIGTVTATAVLDTTEKFQLTVDLTGASTADIYIKMESVGSNVSNLTSL